MGQHGRMIQDLDIDLLDDEKLTGRYHGGLVAILAHTPHLRSLQCCLTHRFLDPDHHLYVVRHLPSLERLSLWLNAGELGESTLQALTHLSLLTSLGIGCVGHEDKPLVLSPTLSALSKLNHLNLTYARPAAVVNEANLMAVVSALTNLTALGLQGALEALPAWVGSLRQLVHLTFAHLRPGSAL